ncbi:MAG: hypothetical protein K1X79_04345 [Oligoflexia bacterium]|nr:hypothetical protein [Oligoflexia bacterium]
MRYMIKQVATLVVLMCCLSACAPRGETKNLDEILAASKARYSRVSSAMAQQDVGAALSTVSKHLEALVSGDAMHAGQDLGQVADLLSQLVSKSGYTVRPAMGEIMAQYRNLASSSGHTQVTSAQLKLLAARTYDLLSGELETTKFGV